MARFDSLRLLSTHSRCARLFALFVFSVWFIFLTSIRTLFFLIFIIRLPIQVKQTNHFFKKWNMKLYHFISFCQTKIKNWSGKKWNKNESEDVQNQYVSLCWYFAFTLIDLNVIYFAYCLHIQHKKKCCWFLRFLSLLRCTWYCVTSLK